MAKKYQLLNEGFTDFVLKVKLPDKITTKDTFICPNGYYGFLYSTEKRGLVGQVSNKFHFDQETFSDIPVNKGFFSKKVVLDPHKHSFFLLKPSIEFPLFVEGAVDEHLVISTEDNSKVRSHIVINVKIDATNDQPYNYETIIREAHIYCALHSIKKGEVFDYLLIEKKSTQVCKEYVHKEKLKLLETIKNLKPGTILQSAVNLPKDFEDGLVNKINDLLISYGFDAKAELI